MTVAEVHELRMELQAARRAESRAEEAAVEELQSARLICRREVAGWAEGRDALVHRLSSEVEEFQLAARKSDALAESEAQQVRALRQAQMHLDDELQRLKRDRDDMHTALCHSERCELDSLHELETTRQQLAGARGRLEGWECQDSTEHRAPDSVSDRGLRNSLSEMTSAQSKIDLLALEHRQLQYEFRAAESRERLSQLEVAEARREAKEARDDLDSYRRPSTQRSHISASGMVVTESARITDDGRSDRHDVIHSQPACATPDVEKQKTVQVSESLVETLKWSTPPRFDPDTARGCTASPHSDARAASPSPGRSALGRPPLAPGSRRSPSSRGASPSRSPSPSRRHGEVSGDLGDGHRHEQLESAGSLPGRELFRRAEELCAVQRFEEAIPLFEEVLRLLREHGSEVAGRDQRPLHIAQADVWAHLGVAMQSLDRMHEALASYGRAVALNPTLHACFANLAALHNHLKNYESSRRYIEKALALSPSNQAYLEIKMRVEEQHAASGHREQPPP